MDVTQVNPYAAPAPAPTPAPESAPAPAPAPAPAVGTGERPEPDMLPRAVREINEALGAHRRHLSITHHAATNRNVIRVYNSETNEIVREIPPERVLDAHANMLEMAGIFVNARG
ncbi:MAG: flagellar protein FlaG [Defluviitaleaceae bacterium]|nr:flagellar protein FlaG [Defluviitaleaceae bacterium]